jgi:hypothetical protein
MAPMRRHFGPFWAKKRLFLRFFDQQAREEPAKTFIVEKDKYGA